MAASPKIHDLEKSIPTEDWTVVLPRRGKKNKTPCKFGIPKQEKKTHQWTPRDTEIDPERESNLTQKMQFWTQKLSSSEFFNWGMDQLNRLIVLGNSFGEYEQYLSICGSSEVADSRKRIFDVRRFTEEIRVDTLSDDSYDRAFHGSSWHFFRPGDGAHLLYDKFTSLNI